MTRKEEYRSTILGIYICVKNFIKWSKFNELRKNELELIIDSCTTLLDSITTIASQDLFIDKDDCLELVLYANKLSNYLKECCE